ncbi:phytoene/squalene synthase family protein [Nocardioides sp. zg-579]|uniref:Phytoene/squalene synthase family protein n=2 Tax=Nocardioides marmotae TaxID=2663857 RepID=A0A6I3J581_9ACTN|nr:phytoene/squalene synthase family protein [Gordonia jinghuaiqii]MTB94304.1 phytoene/squalene synthase family protein [Nocardioides marmotae]QKE03371.1 squalene/phytoene synthase family protein [Nocardioides marmotae]
MERTPGAADDPGPRTSAAGPAIPTSRTGRGRHRTGTAREADRASSPADDYDRVAEAAAAVVIKSYSSSFGLATRLLAEPVRTHVRNVYAMVRVADEVVDAPRPGGSRAQQARVLDALEADVRSAMATGHSANLVVHAFGRSARACGVDRSLVDPFFESMRTDLFRGEHDAASFARYVYGSAEVVGLMCLRAFLAHEPEPQAAYDRLAPGARRLGAAFQKVNFLRDLASDDGQLGRHYFPGLDPAALDDRTRDLLLDDIEADLAAADLAIRELPAGCRSAVALAHGLFAELCVRLRATPAERIRTERVRVPGPAKARVLARTLARRAR